MSASQFPPLQSKPSEKHCPNCSSKMAAYKLPGHYESTVEIDVCMDCNAIWFDQLESSMLSPDGTVALFQLIHERGGASTDAARKFSEGLRCATCREGMKLTNDQVRSTRFTYQACRHGHGRLTTFYNFLAEKQFVRELTRAERTKLAATVKQIRCSGCGAPVDIGKVDACAYCRAPVSVFDREAAKKAIDHYLQERQKQHAPVPGNRREAPRSDERWSTFDRVDLGSDILYALGRVAARAIGGAGRTAPVAGAAGGAIAGSTLETFPDATSAMFGEATAGMAGAANSLTDALPSASDALFGSVSASANSMTEGAAGALADALPSASDALFGSASSAVGDAGASLGGEIASVFSEAASSSLSESVADAASGLAGGALESVAEGGASLAGDLASSAGEGVIDLVTEGISSLLGSLFN